MQEEHRQIRLPKNYQKKTNGTAPLYDREKDTRELSPLEQLVQNTPEQQPFLPVIDDPAPADATWTYDGVDIPQADFAQEQVYEQADAYAQQPDFVQEYEEYGEDEPQEPAPKRTRARKQKSREKAAPEGKRPRKKHRIRNALLKITACGLVLVVGLLGLYLAVATRNDALWLDLNQLSHRDATVLYAQQADGEWAEYARLSATQQKQWVDMEDIPLQLQQAFVAIEDKDFYKHHGVSLRRTAFAVLNELSRMLTGSYLGGQRQGASTITQQLIKNLTIDDDVGGIEGYLRKVREIYRAYKLETEYSKEEILEAYLNIISFTDNTAGVQAESLKLFNKTVDQLTLEQCASIASITRNPYRYDPRRNEETHLTRRNYVLYEMAQQGYITQEEYEAASAQPIGLEAGNVEIPETPVTTYFTDKVITDVSADLAKKYNLDSSQTTHLLYNGGLRIYTTVDPVLQAATEQALIWNYTSYFPQPGVETTRYVYDKDGKRVVDEDGIPVREDVWETPQAAMVTIDYTGALKAVVGGVGEKEVSRSFNRGTSALRQVGSTMKPIGAYALALEKNKINWSTPLMDAPVRKVEDEATGEMRDWPANFSKTYLNDTMPVADALAQSINTIAVRVGERAGVWSMYNFTRNRLHISSFTTEDRAAGPMVLGSSTYGVTPYELAGAYMMFGNGGSYSTLHSYTRVETGYGKELMRPELETEQVISSDTAYVMNRLLKGVMQGNGTASGYALSSDMESIGKTGTSSDNRDFWFVGMTPYYVTATWYGYDSGFALNVAGGTHAPTSAWRAVLSNAQSGLPYKEFPVDESVVTQRYCTESGGLATDACTSVREGYYRAEHLPSQCRLHKAA